MPDFTERDRIRADTCGPFLLGRGIEIGAGISPQRLAPGASALQYDIRSPAELERLFGAAAATPARSVAQIPTDFPHGADFLIAHNVLEHAPDPIGTLIAWHGWVREGGIVALSLPDKSACPDEVRLEPPFGHLLLDYLLGRDAHAFESREHVLSFGLAWPRTDDGLAAGPALWQRLRQLLRRPRTDGAGGDAAARVFADLYEPAVDVHWHAFTVTLTEQTVLAACALAGRRADLLARVDPIDGEPRSKGDIILVYSLHGSGASTGFRNRIEGELATARDAFAKATARLAAAAGRLAPGPTADDADVYPRWISRRDRPASIALHGPFLREQGHCWRALAVVTRSLPDTAGAPRRSTCELLENGRPLGPAHAAHADIRVHGRGRFSHWHQALYFSTSDNSDPNRNGRRYDLRSGPNEASAVP